MGSSKQSELAALMHLVKSCVGTGILSMPLAFKSAGLLVGVLGLIFSSIICTHCVYILVICAHELCEKSGKPSLTYADIAEHATRRGPAFVRKFDWFARKVVDIGIFIAYFTVCSAYGVIIANNFDKFTSFYWGSLNIRLYIAILLIPLLLLSYIPNWKYLTPVSVMSNIFLITGVGITTYYLLQDLPSPSDRKLNTNISTLPTFFGISIFSLQVIGAAMPLENNMKRPQKFLGMFGVLNQGLSVITIIYTAFGFLGYLKYGELTFDNITLNLPANDYLAQTVQILIGLAIFGTYGVQFFICLEIVWNAIKHRYKEKPMLANYVLRTILVIISVAIAIAVPTMGPFISFIGAFCFSIIGIIIPILIEIMTFWDRGFGKYNWILCKDIIVLLTGIMAFIFGSSTAIQDIVRLYQED